MNLYDLKQLDQFIKNWNPIVGAIPCGCPAQILYTKTQFCAFLQSFEDFSQGMTSGFPVERRLIVVIGSLGDNLILYWIFKCI